MKHIKPLSLGKLTLPNNIFYAPLAGCSDYPFRMMSAKYKPGLMFCEMVKMDALVRCDANTFRLLDYHHSMRPIGAQLCGSKPELAGQCAKIIEDLGFDSVDLNCGCPVDKVTKDGSGSGLLKTPHKIGDIIANMKAAVSLPVTIKIRAGWDESTLNAPQITQIAEEAGAQAITIHGRTRVQGYRGEAIRRHIRDCVQAANEIKVIGNGDIFDADSALSFFTETGCDGILVARGTMGKPWAAEDIRRADEGLEPLPRSFEETYPILLEHVEHCVRHGNDKKALLDLRRVACWYLKNFEGAKKVREGVNRSKTLSQALEVLTSLEFEESSQCNTIEC